LKTPTKQPAFPKQGRAADISEVAKLARVSTATVSRVTNGLSTVDQALAERVGAAIRELNYTPNPQGRSLRSGRSRTLGLLVSEITNPFFPELIQSFEDIASASGFEVMVGATNHNLKLARLFITRMVQRRVEGVAVMTFRDEADLLQELISAGIPMVSIDVPIPGQNTAVLQIDYLHGINQAVQHVADLGHRRIAFTSGPPLHLTNVMRKQAFVSSIKNIGLQDRNEWMFEGPHTLEGGMEAARQFIALEEAPTAIICSNDMMALGVLRVLAQSNISVPDDVSVIGFDDVHLAEFVTPPLTTVRMSRELLATHAFQALQDLKQSDASICPIRVETALVVRESTTFVASGMRDFPMHTGQRRA
jgi:DNA-binding LacI/PurR family transcriptional regulator